MQRRRNSLRHPDHDYTRPGAYFITICAYKGNALFGQIVDGVMQLNPLGQIAHQAWVDLPKRHPQISVDPFVIMPNHGHAVISILAETGKAGIPRQYAKPVAGSISTVVNAYKVSVTKLAIHAGLIPGPPLWQRNFYDHIVRTDQELANIREYIRTNPARWLADQLHPDAPPNMFNQW